MTKQLWVDYTNHKGERRWRGIDAFYDLARTLYPPKAPRTEQRLTMCLIVKLADRVQNRTLALTSCHAFFEGTADELRAKHGRWAIKPEQGHGKPGTVMSDHCDCDDCTKARDGGTEPKATDLPDAIKAQLAPGTQYTEISPGVWRGVTPSGEVSVVAEASSLTKDMVGSMVDGVMKGLFENGDVNCHCPACQLRRHLEGNPLPTDETMSDGKLNDLLKAFGIEPEPEVDNETMPQPVPKPEPHQGYEAAGRNAVYKGDFEDDGKVLEEVGRIVRAQCKEHPNTKGRKVALDLHDAGRLLVLAEREKNNPILTFRSLLQANIKRQKEWDRTTALTGDLGYLYRANELAGEVGEACNVVKKLVRESLGITGSRATTGDLADELADVVICCDLLAADYGLNLATAIKRKFNATSEARNLVTRL